MTQQEHLNRIRARCVELLEIAEKRTAGQWEAFQRNEEIGTNYCRITFTDRNSDSLHGYCGENNAVFIASCAGAAEAGWKATIAAIDDSVWQPAPEGFCHPDNPWGVENTALIQQIIASWPAELL